MRLHRLAILSVMALALADPLAAAKIYKWVDEKGVTHYGQSIPPESKDQAASEMTNEGVTVRRWGAAPPPDLRKPADDKAAQERRKEEQKEALEQQRRDTALVNTYTSVKEIDEARERQLQGPLQAIKGLEPRVKKAQDKLRSHQRQADGYAEAGKPVPEGLEQDIAEQKIEIDSMHAEIDRHRARIEAIKARFEADKRRFQQLTQR
jgi:hypothetical protein